MNNFNDKSTLCNKQDDFKEIIDILGVKKQSAKNLNTLSNSQNFKTRKLLNIKGNVLVNSMNTCDSTFSNSPFRSENFLEENSLKNTSKPVRLRSNFFKRIAFDYDNIC